MVLECHGGNIMSIKRLTTEEQRTNTDKIRQSFLSGLTENQIDTYIDNNVTDLTSAKNVLKKLSKIIFYIAKKQNLVR